MGNIDMVCILGPTATGKTRLAAALAARVKGEVVSADSRQVYRGMDVGTGKDLDEYVVDGREVAYHLVDIVDPDYEFNVFEFQKAFLEVFTTIRASDRLPILCGGTGLYLDSVFSRYRMVDAPFDQELRSRLTDESDEALIAWLTAMRSLHNRTDTTERSRIIRAIEIETYVRAHPEAVTELPDICTAAFGIRWERSALRRRITVRLKARLDSGLVEEIRGLLEKGLSPEALSFYGLEYRYVTQYVCGELSRNDMFQKLNAAIHKFAKRQETWFRRMERKGVSITWIDGRLDIEEKLDIILQGISN